MRVRIGKYLIMSNSFCTTMYINQKKVVQISGMKEKETMPFLTSYALKEKARKRRANAGLKG